MSAQGTTGQKKQCVVCYKSGGILICEGCQQTFCGKHVVDHRQDLGLQLDQLMQDHDVLHHEFEQSPTQRSDFCTLIDQWENASIKKIQQAAETARNELRMILEKSKGQLKKTLTDLSTLLRAAREADDFAEQDLNRWTNKLKELRLELKRPASVSLAEEKNSSINLIRLNSVATMTKTQTIMIDPREKFSHASGSVTITENGLLATRIGYGQHHSYIRVHLCYLNCSYGIRFRLEKCAKPYRIFFGCISTRRPLGEETLRHQDVVGWFGFDQVLEHGICSTNRFKYGYQSEQNVSGDVLTLVLDPAAKQIQLINERTATTNVLQVN